jgi:hypothetical protein
MKKSMNIITAFEEGKKYGRQSMLKEVLGLFDFLWVQKIFDVSKFRAFLFSSEGTTR